MLEGWDRTSADEEARVDASLAGRHVDDVLRSDGVTREILAEDEARCEARRERARLAEELDRELRRRMAEADGDGNAMKRGGCGP